MIAVALLAHLACFAPQESARERRDDPMPTLGEHFEARRERLAPLELRLHPVARLTGELRRAALADELAVLADGDDAGEAVRLMHALRVAREEVDAMIASLVATVGERMDPPLEEDVQRLEALDGATLALVGTPAQHAWLQGFLRRCDAFDGLIDVQTHVYTVPRADEAERGPYRSGRVLTAVEADALVRELTGAQIVEAPRVIVRPLQEATLQAVEQVAYVGDYEIKVMPDEDLEVVDPVVMVAESGSVMRLRAVPVETGRIALHARLDFTSLKRPIPSFETTLGGKTQAPVTIQLPEIRRARVEGGFELSAGETLLLRTADPETGEDVLVLIRAERVPATRGR